MAKNLVIVESPAKAKTIEGYLGKDFVVKASIGHVRDLPKNNLAISDDGDFNVTYEITEGHEKVVAELKKEAKKSEVVWLATDEDREGEAISWHLLEALGLNEKNTKRIVFSEITKTAILAAIERPRSIDMDLVNAQQARRILDRIVGFELSPVLWKKIRPSLSAGRVQSVAVRLIVEREREVEAFNAAAYFGIRALFDLKDATLKADLPTKIKDGTSAQAFLEDCVNAEFAIASLETNPSKRSPAAPFTTSTLQQEAGRKLGMSVKATMTVAQKLYESGKITYMRTDSVNLSDFARDAAKDEIIASFGEKYSHPRVFKSKNKGAQEAHEAIRPTNMSVKSIEGESSERRLYDLIWKRTLASQMSDAQLENTTATVNISTREERLVAKGQVVKFDGFLKVYMESTDDEESDESGVLPPLHEGQILDLRSMIAQEKFTQKPARYSEASLVKKLEELGIGRPSTYASTISTIQARTYVEKRDLEGKPRDYAVHTLTNKVITSETKTENTGAERSKLFPTDIGRVVNDFLVENFPLILDYNFTASVEEEFDVIAEGKLEWKEMLHKFYGPFHNNVLKTASEAARASGERLLGEDPATGKPIIARIGRFGPMIQLGSAEEEEKKFASLRPNQSINTITLEEALDLFKMPRNLGEWNGEKIVVGIGRFGPYVKYKSTYASLRVKEGDDPFTIDLPRAIKLVEDKINGVNANLLKTFAEDENVQIINGRFGAYLKSGNLNFKLPKGAKADDISWSDAQQIMEEQMEQATKKAASRKPAPKKAPVKKAPAKKAATKKAPAKKVAAKKSPKK
ncbi:MAG: type topoisomerase [Bacteroidota bacterium]|jgi:DNA topoisomerase-1